MKKFVAALLAFTLLLGSTTAVFATEASDSIGDGIVVDEDDRPYLALGDSLSANEQHTVLSLMGVDAARLDEYDVVYVTNEEEHKYLGDYIPAEQIGTRALSSVLVMKRESGAGINIDLYNINYCTKGMYRNALMTAGITDADIIVAAPFPMSGTAALLGVFEAYEEISGEKLDDDIIDAALDELITTGELEASIDADPEEIESMIADLKQMLADGALQTEEDIRNAIAELEAKYGFYLNEDEIQQIISLLEKFDSLDLSWLGNLSDAGFWAGIGRFFVDIWDTIMSWFN